MLVTLNFDPQDVLNSEFSNNGQLLANYALSNNAGSYDAYSYTNGNMTVKGLYDSNCLVVVLTVDIDAVPADDFFLYSSFFMAMFYKSKLYLSDFATIT
ncbi:hypothetical protein ElyMa_003700200 [Elysia marginata]|uniref:Uncharacterized protein n=1 Tax=Elysia marginata TaxID=1093978 RepID=A0AAV4F452_9GAST|nr:hypothetical protein ElyMa_003700200 [Elysia marginata]